MLRSLFASLLLLLVALPAQAEDNDPVLQAMQDELQHAMGELESRDEPPYFIGLQAIERRGLTITGEEGGLQGYSPWKARWIQSDVRVGEPTLDNTHALRDGSFDDGDSGESLSQGDDVAVLRLSIAESIDERYRAAIERIERVRTDQQVLVQDEVSWDLAPVDPVESLEEPLDVAELDVVRWEDAIRDASSVFAGSPITGDPSVSLSAVAETRWYVSTEGHRIRTSTRLYRVGISVDATSADGTELVLYDAFDSHSAAGLPEPARVKERAAELLAQLQVLLDAPDEEPYQGPVILSGRAAAVFFHEILGHRMEGHRLKEVEDAQTFRNRVGESILPPFLSVTDDPTRATAAGADLRGYYHFDDEGVPAQRTELVVNGKLVGFLQSRSSVGEDGRSNGHGRREPGNSVVTRQGNLIVDSTRTVSEDELREHLIALAREAGLDHALYVDDIQGGFTFTARSIPNAFQIDVIKARRVFVDGRPDEVVRGIDLIGTPLQTFSQIVATSDRPEAFNGSCGAESGWVPVSAVAPAMLVAEIETQRKPKDLVRPPLYAPPALDDSVTDDPLLAALEAEAQRALDELRLGDAPPPAWVTMASRDEDAWTVTARFGEVDSYGGSRGRPSRVEVVVGDYDTNSSRFDGDTPLAPRVMNPRLVVDDAPAALRRDLWITADGSYKAALGALAAKLIARRDTGGEAPPPDWSDAAPVVSIDKSGPTKVDRELLKRIAVEASGALRRVPGLRRANVTARASQGHDYLVTTEGTRLVKPAGYAVVYAFADILQPSGLRLFDRVFWVVRSEADLPPLDRIVADVEQMGRDLAARAQAEPVRYYEGPVVFEDEAAAELFRYLVPPEVRGTPPEPEAGRSYWQQTRQGPRLGRHLLPDGWTIVDDPASFRPGEAGGYVYDDEGVKAEAVTVVEDGYVRDLLMTRSPRAELRRSNGHARGGMGSRMAARLSAWSVRPGKLLSKRAFDQQVSRRMRKAGLERVLVVRRFEQGWEGGLPRPTLAVWRYADGREVPVLALEFNHVDRRVLRNLAVAAGGMVRRPYLAAASGHGRAGTRAGLPSVVEAPRMVLVEEMELSFPGAQQKPPILWPAPVEVEESP